MKKYLLFLLLTALQYGGFAQDIHFTLVDPPRNEAPFFYTGMSQDAQGFLWLTGAGLYKYNGRQFQSYHHDFRDENSLASDRAECVLAAKDGIIWVGTFAGLDRLDPVTNKFTHYRLNPKDPFSIANDTVTAIVQDHEGTLWIGTNGGLEKFDPNTGRFYHHAHNKKDAGSISNNQVRIVYEDRQGTIWAGCGSVFASETPKGEGGLNRMDRKTEKFTHFLHDDKDPNSLTDNRVRAIFEDSRGVFWVGTAGDGLYTLDRKTGILEHHPFDPLRPDKLSRPALKKTITYADDHITFITEDMTGKIWIGTFENGINVYDPKTQKVTHYGADSKIGLKTNELWYAYKTNDGLLWIGSWGDDGIFDLYKINTNPNKVPYHYVGKKVFQFAEDKTKNLWAVTDMGLALRDAHDSLKIVLSAKTLYPSGNTNFGCLIVDDKKNTLWGSRTAGLFNFDPITKTFTTYHHHPGDTNSLICDSVITALKDGPGRLWVGTYRGLDLMNTETGTFRHIQQIPTDTTRFSNGVISLLAGKKEKLWVGTVIGLDRLDEHNNNVKRYLIKKTIFSIKEDNQGNLWAGTAAGLFKYNPVRDDFENFTDKFGVLNPTLPIPAITTDKQNNLWLSTPAGLIKLNTENKETTLYAKGKGVDGGRFTLYSYTTKNGEVLISDTMGYYHFYPEKLLSSTPAPNVSMVNLFLADKAVLPGPGSPLSAPVARSKEINLSHDQNTFSLVFESIDYISEEANNRLQYKLENYDANWRIAEDSRMATYFNIAPGKYIFKVKSLNDNGLWAEKDIVINISLPWWQRWWAFIIYVVLFAGIIWCSVTYRSLQLIKEKRILEHRVQVRTEEVMQQKEEIETQRDNLEKAFKELKTTQTQLIQSEKMASLGELTAGIAHEIQNPLNFVNNFSEVNTELIDEMKHEILNGNFDGLLPIAEDIKENEQKINMHGKRADAIVKAMLQHSRSSSGQREPTNINALADEYLRLAYHGLRAKDKSFNAITETHFDKSIGEITINPQDIGRVILNLLNNAFYAVNEKKKRQPGGYGPTVTVSTKKLDDRIEVAVKDNGNGIPQKILDKIYQPFFTTKPTGQGTGLGLSMSYDIIKAHGGELRAETVEGEFTEFTILLPV